MKIYSCCGNESVTKKYFCPVCGGSEFKEKEVSDAGTVYSFTKIHVAPSEFADIAPYNVVLIDLDEADCKVTARMLENVSIGDRVTLQQIDEGAYIYQAV